NANGTIGTWLTGPTLPSARSGASAAVFNGALYVTGGRNAVAALGEVIYSPITSPGGSLGAWTQSTAVAPARFAHGTVAYNGWLYVIGGEQFGGGALSDAQVASINASGGVGPWVATTALPGVRQEHATVVYGGRIYVLGG